MSKNAPDAPAERGVSTSVIGVAFEALRQRLVAEGCFEPNYPDEVFKLVLTIGPGFLGARLLHSGMPALGTLLISFSLYLCGWTAHDYLHHGVLKGSSKRMVHPNPNPHPHPNPNPNPHPNPDPRPWKSGCSASAACPASCSPCRLGRGLGLELGRGLGRGLGLGLGSR